MTSHGPRHLFVPCKLFGSQRKVRPRSFLLLDLDDSDRARPNQMGADKNAMDRTTCHVVNKNILDTFRFAALWKNCRPRSGSPKSMGGPKIKRSSLLLSCLACLMHSEPLWSQNCPLPRAKMQNRVGTTSFSGRDYVDCSFK